MQDQETKRATPDERIAHQAKTWRRAEKKAIGERTDTAKRAQHRELQRLREAVDTLGER
jgi:hypothetical protein